MSEDSGNSFSLVKLDGKPLEKLIETVSAGIGTLYKPRAIRKEAEAKAYEIEKIAEAKAKSNIIKYENDTEIAERARQRLYYQEMQRQVNIENVIEKSIDDLNEVVSEKPVDEDWRTKFFTKVQDITSEDMQSIWAKILANEINQPGQISVRTLDVLSNLSKEEARLFSLLSSLSTQSGNIIKIKGNDLSSYGLNYDSLSVLRAAGLLLASDNMNITYLGGYKINATGAFGHNLLFKSFYLIVTSNKIDKYIYDQFRLTPAGDELLKIVGEPANILYVNELKEYIKSRGYGVDLKNIIS
jgi:hypothetical protein